MSMSPEQKIKWAILALAASWSGKESPPFPCENVDDLYDYLVEQDEHWDAMNEIRGGHFETRLGCPLSRNYETKGVAMKFPDGSYVGWTYYYGGGKYGNPEDIEWMDEVYDVICQEEEKLVVVRTFSQVEL